MLQKKIFKMPFTKGYILYDSNCMHSGKGKTMLMEKDWSLPKDRERGTGRAEFFRAVKLFCMVL